MEKIRVAILGVLLAGVGGFVTGSAFAPTAAEAVSFPPDRIPEPATCPGGSQPFCVQCGPRYRCTWACAGGYFCIEYPSMCAFDWTACRT